MFQPSVFRQCRLSGGFTFREVGSEAGLAPSSIASYEVGRARPSVDAMNKWGGALLQLLDRRASEVNQALRGLKAVGWQLKTPEEAPMAPQQ